MKYFKFASGDDLVWLIAAKDQVYGWCYNEDRTILMASTSDVPFQAKWFRRPGRLEDPWISLKDHVYCVTNNCILYGGNSFGGPHAQLLSLHNGADVFINTQD